MWGVAHHHRRRPADVAADVLPGVGQVRLGQVAGWVSAGWISALLLRMVTPPGSHRVDRRGAAGLKPNESVSAYSCSRDCPQGLLL